VSEVADGDEFAVTPPASSTPVEGLESFEDEDQDFAAPEFAIPQDFSTSPEFSAPDESATPHRDATPVASFTPVSSTPVSSEMPVEPSVPVSAADDTPGRATTPAGSSEIFVTETMADLYLSQGHVDSALDIYRRLLEHRPDDARLAERIREVESRASGQTEVVETPEAAAEPVAPRGPTIREFLVALVGGNSGVADFAPEASAEAQVAPFIPDESVSGSIDALFSDTEPSSGAESSVLAEAFSEQSSDAPMLEGRPSHPASNELSLDQVFKVATPVRTEAQPDGFSFDQFFAGEPNSSTASPPTNTPPAEGTDDIAQFNAWLNGLKKT
jgi:hypothetical protein